LRLRRSGAPAEASRSQGLERHPATTELFGNERRQRALLAQRIKRLLREARVAVDVLGVRRRDLLGDARDALEEGPVAVDGDAHDTGSARTSSRASEIAAMLAKTLRVSMRSGNSTSKRSSSASMTLTLAWEVNPDA